VDGGGQGGSGNIALVVAGLRAKLSEGEEKTRAITTQSAKRQMGNVGYGQPREEIRSIGSEKSGVWKGLPILGGEGEREKSQPFFKPLSSIHRPNEARYSPLLEAGSVSGRWSGEGGVHQCRGESVDFDLAVERGSHCIIIALKYDFSIFNEYGHKIF
jgi:hypothetical protein